MYTQILTHTYCNTSTHCICTYAIHTWMTIGKQILLPLHSGNISAVLFSSSHYSIDRMNLLTKATHIKHHFPRFDTSNRTSTAFSHTQTFLQHTYSMYIHCTTYCMYCTYICIFLQHVTHSTYNIRVFSVYVHSTYYMHIILHCSYIRIQCRVCTVC